MKYGYFDDINREYVITTPHTPYPWINYLGKGGFTSLISHTGGGYSFYKDARLRRITRYRYNNVPADIGGNCFYIREGDEIWSPLFKPVMAPIDWFECRHGMGYTSISSIKNGIKTSALFFVPTDADCQIQKITVTNQSAEKREIKLFAMQEFCMWNALDDMTNFQRNLSTGEVETEDGIIYHKTEYRERRNHYSFYGANRKPDSFDTDRDTFLGDGGFTLPAAVLNGKCFGSIAQGWSPIAAHCFNITLMPKESKVLIFILGYAELPDGQKWQSKGIINKLPAKKIIDKFSDCEKIDKAFLKLKDFWDGLLDKFSVNTPDEHVNRMANIWNQYQTMVTFNLSRSASYFESGIGRGMGFRDSSQDILGFAHQIPDAARARILDLAATQLEDGGAYHQFQPLTKKGNHEIGGNFRDDPLWIILAVCAYVRETGDYGILSENVPFNNDEKLSAPLSEHLKRAFTHVSEATGPHGLPLIGRADWNDCLNLNCFSLNPDESFQTTSNSDGKTAESVLIACMLVYIGKDYAKLLKKIDDEFYKDVEKTVNDISYLTQKFGWDGEWFLRAYDNFSSPVGSSSNEEGKIFIETQGFGAMAGIGEEKDMPKRALNSAWKYLFTKYGMVLNQPAYTVYHPELGEISSYPPGYKENAGIFCHNNPWIMLGEAAAKRGDNAFECYKAICPSYTEQFSDIHKTEPYVYSQMIAGKDCKNFGQAKNSWLTGTASWNFVALSQGILGIRPEYDGLKIIPCFPSGWQFYSVRRKYRGCTYDINVRRCESGQKAIKADGKLISGDIVPAFTDGKNHLIEVEI